LPNIYRSTKKFEARIARLDLSWGRPIVFWHDLVGRHAFSNFVVQATTVGNLYFQYLRLKHGCPAILAIRPRSLLYKFNYAVLVSKQNTAMATNI
jgi:hypothetical protein